MALDEFGREIPGLPSSYQSSSHFGSINSHSHSNHDNEEEDDVPMSMQMSMMQEDDNESKTGPSTTNNNTNTNNTNTNTNTTINGGNTNNGANASTGGSASGSIGGRDASLTGAGTGTIPGRETGRDREDLRHHPRDRDHHRTSRSERTAHTHSHTHRDGGGSHHYERSHKRMRRGSSRSRSHSPHSMRRSRSPDYDYDKRDRDRDRDRERDRSRDRSRDRNRERDSNRDRGRDRDRDRYRTRDDYRDRDRDRDRERDRSRERARDGARSRDRDRDRDRSRDRDRDRRYHTHAPITTAGSRPRSDSRNNRDIGGSDRDRGGSASGIDRDRDRGGSGGGDRDRDRGGRRKAISSELYVDYPMLCQHLWNIEQERLMSKRNGDDNNDGTGNNDNNDSNDNNNGDDKMETDKNDDNHNLTQEKEENDTEHSQIKTEDNEDVPNIQNENNDIKIENNDMDTMETTEQSIVKSEKEQIPQQPQETYDEYIKRYCLHYIHSFFNSHLDDEWFRQRYSPLQYKRFVEKERNRAKQEALVMMQEIQVAQQSLQSYQDGDASLSLKSLSSESSFVTEARLGGGVKPSSSNNFDSSSSLIHHGHHNHSSHHYHNNSNSNSSHHHHHHHGSSSTAASILSSSNNSSSGTTTLTTSRKRKYNSTSDAPATNPASMIDPSIPKSHLLSFVKDNRALHIMDIPPNINDTQLLLAIKDHCDVGNSSSTGNGNSNSNSTGNNATDATATGASAQDNSGGGDAVPSTNTTGGGTNTGNSSNTGGGVVIGNVYPIEIYSSMVVDGVCAAVTDSFTDSDGTSNGNIGILGHSSSTGMGSSSTSGTSGMLYHRNAWAIFESEAAKEKMLDNLVRANLEANRHARDSRGVPKSLELDVDCSDPYGRYEIDATGTGEAEIPTPDGTTGTGADASTNANAANASKNPSSSAPTKVPLKRVTVFVATSPPIQHQQTVVLSAAVSSTKRIPKDCKVAYTIAKRMDTARGVPSDLGCQMVLNTLFPNLMHEGLIQADDKDKDNSNGEDGKGNKNRNQMIEDALDVTIAYLRRVHLFSFYNGCTFSDNVGAVVGGSHPAGVVHVRLKGADEILRKTREENADMYDDLPMADDKDKENTNDNDSKMNDDANNDNDVDLDEKTKGESTAHSAETKDMLVMRLDDSIEKVLSTITEEMEILNPYCINETVDTVANEIESLEQKSKKEWINNHAVIDGDGRARCSFHFCNKLFKDKNFLQKHLLKKHPEFLQAEMAKSHDSYMMNWWDKEEVRPVPQVCIDCGPTFGLRLSSVIGASDPTTIDPEPDLWREEQDRIRKFEEAEEKYREKIAAAANMEHHGHGHGHSNNHHHHHHTHHHSHGKNSDAQGSGVVDATGNTASSNFVDVDDMKDEKVELSFENVNVVAPPVKGKGSKKKKKKKKKLL